jgi:uncharacterized membrane protein YeaQ/YmgE (transglycosylase-associated protein family)
MNIIVFLIFGAIVGWIASIIMKTNSSQGMIGDIILGVLGALAGGFVMNLLNLPGVSGFNIYSFIVSVLGAVIVVTIGRALSSTVR